MRIVEVGQYFMTKDTGDFRQFRSVACREDTLLRDDGQGGWGPQGRSSTGGGGLARVPNLRVCKHLWKRGGTRRGGRANQRPAVVPSSRRGKNLQ